MYFYPVVGTKFDITHEVGKTHIGAQPQQNVDVVLYAVDLIYVAVLVANGGSNVVVEDFGRLLWQTHFTSISVDNKVVDGCNCTHIIVFLAKVAKRGQSGKCWLPSGPKEEEGGTLPTPRSSSSYAPWG